MPTASVPSPLALQENRLPLAEQPAGNSILTRVGRSVAVSGAVILLLLSASVLPGAHCCASNTTNRTPDERTLGAIAFAAGESADTGTSGGTDSGAFLGLGATRESERDKSESREEEGLFHR